MFYSFSVSADTRTLTILCWHDSFIGVEPGYISTAMVSELILFRCGNNTQQVLRHVNGMLRQTLPCHTRLCAGNSSGRVTASHWFNTILSGKLFAGGRKKPKILISLEQMIVRNSYRLGLCITDLFSVHRLLTMVWKSKFKFGLTVSLKVQSTSKPSQCPLCQWQASKTSVVLYWH